MCNKQEVINTVSSSKYLSRFVHFILLKVSSLNRVSICFVISEYHSLLPCFWTMCFLYNRESIEFCAFFYAVMKDILLRYPVVKSVGTSFLLHQKFN